jgi:hypothetical protein
MTPVKAFKSDDGLLFTCYDEAQKHNIRNILTEGDSAPEGALVERLIARSEALIKALKPQRKRTVKAKAACPATATAQATESTTPPPLN